MCDETWVHHYTPERNAVEAGVFTKPQEIQGDSRVVASRISKQEPKRARVRFPVGAKKFSDGTCKYLPFVELLLC